MEQVNEAIGETIFLLEKALDPYKAPEERERFTKKALEELKGVYIASVIENDDEDEDEEDLMDDFDEDDDDELYEDDEDDDDEDDDDEDDDEEGSSRGSGND